MLELNNNMKIPKIGLGTWACNPADQVVYDAIKAGVRLIDTASYYKVEEGLGKGIQKAIADGIIKREDLFIITKTWIHERQDPITSLKNSLKRLNLDYVDLFLDHWPTLYTDAKDCLCPREKMKPMHLVWPEMEKCVELGLTKSIGVSNYNVQSLCNLLSFCKIKPVANEVEFHPYLYQKNLLDFCNKENIKIISYCPIFRGKAGVDGNNLFEEPVIKDLAQKYGKTEAQIILNWHLTVGVVPIPATNKKERQIENLGALDFQLAKEDVDTISKLNKMFRICYTSDFGGAMDVFA